MFNAIKQGMLKGIRSAAAFTNPGALATLSSTQAKMGPTSGYFPGTNVNAAIYVPASTKYALGTAPFTIEGWYYQTALTNSYPTPIGNDWNTRVTFGANDWVFQPARAGTVRQYLSVGNFSTGGPMLSGTTTLSNNAWQHFAIVRTATTGAVMATSTITAGTGVLTVGTLSSGTISVGLYLTGTGVPAGTYITANISGTGTGSTWQTNTTTGVASTTITGNNFNLYVNGTNEARVNSSISMDGGASRSLSIGTFGTNAVSPYTGYLDEMRMSNVARYFTNFTPSTTPFIDDANTLLLMHFDGANGVQSWVDDNT